MNRLLTGLLVLALLYAALVLAVALWQKRLLYLPMRAPVAQLVDAQLRAWPSAQDFRGLLAEPVVAPRGTAIVFHGNAGHAGHRAHYAAALRPLGWRVILAEYPGYGPREGEPGERALVDDAAQAIDHARREHGAPLVVIGESLGAAVAAQAAAARREQVAGLLLVTPWQRLEDVAAHHYAWLPVRQLLADRYDSASHLAGFDRPVWVAVAGRDDIVPTRFGLALHQGLTGPKRLALLDGADHNDWPLHVDARWWQEALDFLAPRAP